jgi:hydroxymethylbilane synthase
MPDRLVLATRGSKLALAQSEWVRDELQRLHPGLRVELLILKTTGDKILDTALPQIDGKGLFTREIEEALLDGRAHLAVHSLKDLPTELPEGLTVAAMPERVDPRDVLICREATGLDDLPEAALIGTCSPRRSAQLAHYRPDLRFVSIRGNVDTRLRKLADEGLDAIVLAAAGLIRLGLADCITQILPTDISLPATGQGIIGIEARAEDAETLGLLAAINSPISQTCAAAERAVLAGLGGGCQTPIGVLAQVAGDTCSVEAVVLGEGGEPYVRACQSGPAAEAAAVGRMLADDLLLMGADDLLA